MSTAKPIVLVKVPQEWENELVIKLYDKVNGLLKSEYHVFVYKHSNDDTEMRFEVLNSNESDMLDITGLKVELQNFMIDLTGKKIVSEVARELSHSPTDKVTRVEVIDEHGRSYTNWKPNNRVELQFQDEGRTLKIFISQK
jgi:hypothetical protein